MRPVLVFKGAYAFNDRFGRAVSLAVRRYGDAEPDRVQVVLDVPGAAMTVYAEQRDLRAMAALLIEAADDLRGPVVEPEAAAVAS